MSGTLLHLVLETPGCNAVGLLKDATMEDSPLPIFTYHQSVKLTENKRKALEKDESSETIELSLSGEDHSDECFLFLSLKIDLADQIQTIIELFGQTDNFFHRQVSILYPRPLLHEPPEKLTDWIDAGAHFSDVMLFTGRNNENSSYIQTIQDRYSNMRFPMESFILGKKNTPWARILRSYPASAKPCI